MNNAQLLKLLPSVTAVLQHASADADSSHRQLVTHARQVIEIMRAEIVTGNGNHQQMTRESLLIEAARRLSNHLQQQSARRLRRVINATGVILHTNLGRAPLASAAREAVAREAARYCTLEYDLESGERGRRGARAEDLLCEITRAEAALVVNNCAAATILTLASLAQDGETIISRGELVTIGGDFRIPDVMRTSGTQMREVGTTNRTTLEDYEQAINPNTKLIVRVHPSNYRVVGFTHRPSTADLAELAHTHHLVFYEDAGSGALIDFAPYGLPDEPVISRSIADGADIVSFSGDKLLGAAQAGCIVGNRKLINRLRRTPLARAVRIDKLSLAALEATLEFYLRDTHLENIPALQMISATQDKLKSRASNFIERTRAHLTTDALTLEIRVGTSAIGGGSAPLTHPLTILISLTHAAHTADQLANFLRHSTPPVIARIEQDKLLLDLRTVQPDEEHELLQSLLNL